MAWGGAASYHYIIHKACMVVMEVTGTLIWIKAMLSGGLLPCFPLPVPCITRALCCDSVLLDGQ